MKASNETTTSICSFVKKICFIYVINILSVDICNINVVSKLIFKP